ncbi:hypothetical protein ABZX12_13585 [Kribbella sp. NPDC003505]|uniref:hypothetical protein n=1 Tax=Kribbella sp. NPDC003505 TaxID=3154448 RepID=UPI0033BF7541
MGYAEFEAEYKRVYEVILNGRGDRDLSADVARLSALAAQIDDEDDRENAYLMRIENATPEEAGAIGSMEHVLRMLADALRLQESAGSRT